MTFLPLSMSLVGLSVALLGLTANAQMAVQSGMTSDSHCGQGYCLTGIYLPSSQSINYTMVVPEGGKPIGWWGIAQGTKMKGANYALCWVNPDNATVTISNRGATDEDDPTPQLAPSPATFSTNDEGKSQSGVTYWSWNMPLPASSSSDRSKVQHIFAMNAVGPSTSDVNAHLKKHTRYEQGITLDLTKPYTGAAPVGLVVQSDGGVTSSPATASEESGGLEPTNKTAHRLFIVHMVFMLIAWLIVVPAGIFIARFGRTIFAWYPHHRNVQLVGLLFIFVGFFFAVGAVAASADTHFDSAHEKLGLALLVIVIVQSIMGLCSHQLRKRFGARAVGLVHIPLGLLLFGLSIWEIHLGLEKYKPKAPQYASDIIYAWSALLAAVYVIGFYKVRRELAQDRDERKYTQSGSIATSGTSSPQDEAEGRSMRQV